MEFYSRLLWIFLLVTGLTKAHRRRGGHNEERGFYHGRARRWRFVPVHRRPMADQLGIGLVDNRLTSSQMKDPNTPVVVPYEVTPEQILTLLRH